MRQLLHHPLFICRTFMFIGGLSLANIIQAQSPYQSVDVLQHLAKKHIDQALTALKPAYKAQVNIGNIDRRLKLADCQKDEIIFFSPHDKPLTNSGSLGIRCLAPVQWTVFVRVKIKKLLSVIVAQRHLPKNHIIKNSDLKQASIDITQLRHGYFIQKQPIVGMVTKRAIRLEKPITPHRLKLARLIHKGETVTITAVSNALKVSMKGIALSGGRIGDVIAVKNLTSSRTIEARITGSRQVEVKI